MKKLSLLLFALLIGGNIFAQGIRPGSVTPLEFWTQMWNASSTYYGTVTSSNIGTQSDTVTTSAAIYLSTSQLVNATRDTCYIWPLTGGSSCVLNFYCYAAKNAATVPNVLFALQESINGSVWTYIPADTVTLHPTSLTVYSSASFQVTGKPGRYFRWEISTGAANAKVFAGLYFTKPD